MLKPAYRPIHPAICMVGFWSIVYATYFFAPIEQTPAASIWGALFVCTMIFIFALTAVLGAARSKYSSNQLIQHGSARRVVVNSRWLNAFFTIGIFGAVVSILAKTASLDLLSLAGSYALRTERAQQLLEGGQISSGVWGVLGFLCYPAGFVAVVVTILRYECLSTYTRALAAIYVPLIFLLSVAAGGRSPILVTILLVGLSAYLRKCRGLPIIPRSRTLKYAIVGLVAGFLTYSTIIWEVRSEAAELDIEGFLQHADQAWGVRPTEGLEWFAATMGDQGLVKSIMSTIFYFTQCLSVIERILGTDSLPTLFAGYHIDLVAAVMRAMPNGAEYLAEGYATLLDENIYGYFAGAWGSLLIDFGLLGCFVAVAVWGWFAGCSYRRARLNIHNDRVILYIFWVYSILISFISPPFGFSNSALTFFWFFTYVLCATPQKRIAALSP